MAKILSKAAPKEPKAAPAKAGKPVSKAAEPSIEHAAEEALSKLKILGLEPQLQADLEWCLGSFKSDLNPSGLYEMTERAVAVFNAEKEKKTKGVTAKFVTDLNKAIKSR